MQTSPISFFALECNRSRQNLASVTNFFGHTLRQFVFDRPVFAPSVYLSSDYQTYEQNMVEPHTAFGLGKCISTPFIELCSKKTVLNLKINWEFQLSGERKAELQDKVDKKLHGVCYPQIGL